MIEENLRLVYLEASDICGPEPTLRNISIEFAFFNTELASITLLSSNDKKTQLSKTINLMKFARRSYGDFNTGFDDSNYYNFHVWQKNKSYQVYYRYPDDENVWQEEILITSEKYDDVLAFARSGEDVLTPGKITE